MIRFTHLRKAVCTSLVAIALAPAALLLGQAARPHTALAFFVPPPPPLDGTWVSTDTRISSVQVTRQTTAISKGGPLLTRFVVQAFHGTQSVGTGSTAWQVNTVGASFGTKIAVTVSRPCSTEPVCPKLSTDLNLSSENTLGGPAAFLIVVDHTLVGDVSWTEWLSPQP